MGGKGGSLGAGQMRGEERRSAHGEVEGWISCTYDDWLSECREEDVYELMITVSVHVISSSASLYL